MSPLPTYEDVLAAAARLEGVARCTPVVTSRTLDERLKARVFLKAESFQRMGAFKFRGAYNAIARLEAAARGRGIVTHSSGNHAQAVALACKLLGARATVVMPADAPAVKWRAVEGYGATVVAYDPSREVREEVSGRLAAESSAVLVPPFDHPDVIAGQGTAARELFEETGDLDLLLVPCGGGGLLSGSALSARALSPRCRVVGVEPEAGDDGMRSFRSGTLQTVSNPRTIADGARTPSLGRLTFALIRELVADMVAVSDAELLPPLRFLWERTKLVVEPTGALGLAAAWSGKAAVEGRRVGVILSGGNADVPLVASLLAALPPDA